MRRVLVLLLPALVVVSACKTERSPQGGPVTARGMVSVTVTPSPVTAIADADGRLRAAVRLRLAETAGFPFRTGGFELRRPEGFTPANTELVWDAKALATASVPAGGSWEVPLVFFFDPSLRGRTADLALVVSTVHVNGTVVRTSVPLRVWL